MARAITVISARTNVGKNTHKLAQITKKSHVKVDLKVDAPWYSLSSFSVLDSEHRLFRIGDVYENIIDNIHETSAYSSLQLTL